MQVVHAMLRARKGQQKVPTLKKTIGLCPSVGVISLLRYMVYGIMDIFFTPEQKTCKIKILFGFLILYVLYGRLRAFEIPQAPTLGSNCVVT